MQISGGNASKEGMTLDLEALASAGFGGIHLFHESSDGSVLWPGVTNPIPCMSRDWGGFIGHVGRECRRLGLRLLLHGCPGWSMAGGPWVPAEKAMRELVAACVVVGEGETVRVPRPAMADDHPWRDYRDIAVVAFPSPAGDVMRPLVPVAVRGTPTHDQRTVRLYSPPPMTPFHSRLTSLRQRLSREYVPS